jgi:uncharacterized membrane protein (DUF4010 family)
MSLEELSSRIALAFGIGLLIGLERGWHTREARPGTRSAGIRTFTLSGLLGGITAAMAQEGARLTVAGGILLGVAFSAYAAVFAVFNRDENRSAGNFSATTTIAALLTFMLGAYALIGDQRIAAASAVAVAGILVIREPLHAWVAKITLAEFQSGLVLLAMTFIALPVVPDRAIGPFGGVNLRAVWLIAIMLAAISFSGYVAVKLFGERRGTLVAAATGGVISSTAVALASARRAAAGEGSARLLAAGVTVAMAVSFIRVAVIVVVLKPAVVALIAPALLVGAIVAAVFAIVSVRAHPARNDTQPAFRFGNPFGFWSVLAMAGSIGVLMVAGRLIAEEFGSAGAIAGAAAMGLFDVDAMAVSMLNLSPAAIDARALTYAVLTGVACNTFVKVGIAALIGRGPFARQIAVVCAVCVLAGWATVLVTVALMKP